MKLLEVDISGFKSFAHKTHFQLSDGLTAIIGPNGSGKSNLAEAIRWVLGEQSLKSLRGRKSDDVIFAGTRGHKRSGSATVSLTFANDDGRLAVEAPEVTISRRLTRDGEGEYLLNGDPVRLLDLQQLLAEAGIGTKSYAVISQGTVDRYLNATPAQRRELFDEATGIKALQLKVQQAERHLHQADQAAQELRAIIQELEPRLQVLQRQVTRHHQCLELSAEFTKEQAAWFQVAWHERSAAYQTAIRDAKQAEEHIAVTRQAREAVEEQLLQALDHKENPHQPAGLTHLREQVQRAEHAYLEAQRRYDRDQAELATLNRSLETLATQRRQAEAELSNARQQLERSNAFTSLRHLLERSQALLTQWLAGKPLDHTTVTELRASITETLTTTAPEKMSLRAAHDVVRQLEEPLQTVARLSAIEHERSTRRTELSNVLPPSRTTWDELKAKLMSAEQIQPRVTSRHEVEASLEQVRTAELAAERAGSTAAAHVAHTQAALQSLEAEIRRERGTAFLQTIQAQPPDRTTAVTEADLARLAARLAQLGEIDPLALKEYEETSDRYTHLQQQLRDIEATYHKTNELIRSLRREMNTQFRQQFAIIRDAFRHHIRRLFDGGEADLTITVEDNTDHDSSLEDDAPVPGIEVLVHPPGKKPHHIGLLSGGEKALTSLALLFAILEVQQPPFLVLDEVDAALDEANSYRFAEMLQEKSQTTQCIMISHNRETMSHADVLYGITMQQDGISRAYSVKLHEISHTEPAEEIPV